MKLHEMIKETFKGIIPMSLRDEYRSLVKGEKTTIFIPYDIPEFKKICPLLCLEGVDFYDGQTGVTLFKVEDCSHE